MLENQSSSQREAGHIYPQYIDGPNGQLLFTFFAPPQSPNVRKAVLCLPPFAEEMNKSRRMMALQGRMLAKNGIAFLVPDLYGTGDSDGDFHDADFTAWCADIRCAIDWIHSQKIEQIDLLAIRFGSLFVDTFHQYANQRKQKIALWNPVVSGEKLLNQFLRTKLVADMSAGVKTSIPMIREQLRDDGQIEVAGYFITEKMVSSVDQASLDQLSRKSAIDLLWTDTGVKTDRPPPTGTADLLSQWSEKGIKTDYRRIEGPQFWISPEIREATQLLNTTTEFFG